MDLGFAYFRLGRLNDALNLLGEARSLAARGPDRVLPAEITLRLGLVLTRLGYFQKAEETLREGLAIAAATGDAYEQAGALGNIGYNYLFNSRFDEALPWFEKALQVARKINAQRSVASLEGSLGRCYYGLGDYEKAEPLLRRAADTSLRIGDLNARLTWLAALGDQALYQRGEVNQAREYYVQALTLARQVGEQAAIGRELQRLTILELRAGKAAQAERYSRESVELSGRLGSRAGKLWAEYVDAAVHEQKGEDELAAKGFRRVIASATGAEDRNAAWEAHRWLGGLCSRQHRWRAAETEYQAALSELESARSKLARDEWKLSFRSGAKQLYYDYVAFLMDRGQPEKALETAESSRARTLAQKLGVLDRLGGQARLRETARRLNATLVSIWLAPGRSFAWVVTPRKVHTVTLAGEAEINQSVEAYRTAVQGQRDPLETGNPAGRRLSELLLAPIARFVPRGTRVIIAPDGPLYELNLEALPAPSGTPRYWIEDVTLSVVPSLALLGAGASNSVSGAGPLLAIGNPVSPSPDYPQLAYAAAELDAVGHRFPGSTTIAGATAHPAAYRETNPARFSLIHFAAHAVGNRESPLESAIILSRKGERYKLYARDVIGVPLQARLVTISACRSAGARVYSGEGLVGFAWAFLEAGAHNVIAGLWDVNDRSTATLMDRLYAGLAAGQSPADALRTAKLSLLKEAGPYRKPYYWAPFQLFERGM